MKKCLIFLEKQYEKFCIDLLETANQMYGENFVSYALSIDADVEAATDKFDEIISVENRQIICHNIHIITRIIGELYKEIRFDGILILATHYGRMLAPALSMKLGIGLVADVTQISHYKDKIEMVRPAFSGKILAGIINTRDDTVMMTVRPGVFLYENTILKKAKIWSYIPDKIDNPKLELISRRKKPETRDIRDSEILVSGGGGILNDFDCIDELAKRLGGMKAASRRVVDSGKADRSIQVGQSGKIVHPRLYIALGICGVLQHVAGLNHVQHIISVNTNKNAPMCSLADIVVEGDARVFVDSLIERIDREKMIQEEG